MYCVWFSYSAQETGHVLLEDYVKSRKPGYMWSSYGYSFVGNCSTLNLICETSPRYGRLH